jgi:hypothetical protein
VGLFIFGNKSLFSARLLRRIGRGVAQTDQTARATKAGQTTVVTTLNPNFGLADLYPMIDQVTGDEGRHPSRQQITSGSRLLLFSVRQSWLEVQPTIKK